MSMLKGLTFTTAPEAANLISPIEYRRNKLVANLLEQRDIAQADAEGRELRITRKRWELTDTGEKKRVEVAKRLKRWWSKDADGKVILVVRRGARLLELNGDKTAIAISDRTKLVAIIDRLVDTTQAGELDTAMEKSNTARSTLRKGKGGA